MKKVIGIGNALVDVLVRMDDDSILSADHLPKGSMQLIDLNFARELDKTLAKYPKKFVSGGSAANTISGLSMLGVPSAFVGKICEDEYGRKYEEDLQSYGVVSRMIQGDSMSGFCTALISPDGERTMATFLGAAAQLSAHEITEEVLKGYDILHIEGYLLQNYDLILNTLQKAKKLNMEVSLDLASYNVVEQHIDFLKQIVSDYVDIIFANEDEAHAYTSLSPEQSLEKMAQNSKIAVVKVGAKGSYAQCGDERVQVDAYDAQRIDTTGAGDLYASGFLYGYVQNKDLLTCAKIGSYISSKLVEIVGTKFSDEQWADIKKVISVL
ncbi:MAG: adenosine kinase [Bacteroidales bacterium]|nr:adenosine kinase [Bacteroidales bacterium]